MELIYVCSFSAEVWGTVSDWIMIIATVATLIYLRETLQSQKEVMKLQLKETRISNEIYRKENLPVFEINVKNLNTSVKANVVTTVITLYLKLQNTYCRNAIIIVASTNSELNFRDEDIFSKEVVEEDSINQIEVTSIATFEEFNNGGIFVIMTLNYEDPVANKYSHSCKITIGNGNTHIEIEDKPTLHPIN